MKHRILIIEAEIKLFDSHSLKEKRVLRQKLTEKLRRDNISIAETGNLELWDLISLTISSVAIDQSAAERKSESLENRICEILEQDGSGELILFTAEII
jgi:uncharacterized protein YlxP (DUF503 family)